MHWCKRYKKSILPFVTKPVEEQVESRFWVWQKYFPEKFMLQIDVVTMNNDNNARRGREYRSLKVSRWIIGVKIDEGGRLG